MAPFDISELREITSYDELDLDTLGDKKSALFLIMSDNDPTFNFLISLVYTQLFNLLCEKADDVYHGRLPVHVRCLIDEAANIGQIQNLEKLVATIRSREISACLVLQTRSQLKAIYKDHADTIVGNMDSQLFLGGSEPTTLKELSQALGKETSDTYNTGETRGREQSNEVGEDGNPFMKERDFLDIDEFCVDEAYRRKGVATSLITFIKEYAKEKGFHRIELNMWEFNKGALAFYESVGFETYRRYMEIML